MSDLQEFLNDALKKVSIRELKQPIISESIVDYDIYKEIAELIISARIEENLTQGELARASGVPQGNISKFENGNSHPNIGTLKKIADGLGKKLVIRFENVTEVE